MKNTSLLDKILIAMMDLQTKIFFARENLIENYALMLT
jgi:hypothetical protein